eukprot:GHVU01199786.1.p1 GENE.GHVU01199786.1~~GHVU01199786.1.p1  ORF type:complete len:1070 (+),score=163.79 GHVU01199786.1:229-3210(+)
METILKKMAQIELKPRAVLNAIGDLMCVRTEKSVNPGGSIRSLMVTTMKSMQLCKEFRSLIDSLDTEGYTRVIRAMLNESCLPAAVIMEFADTLPHAVIDKVLARVCNSEVLLGHVRGRALNMAATRLRRDNKRAVNEWMSYFFVDTHPFDDTVELPGSASEMATALKARQLAIDGICATHYSTASASDAIVHMPVTGTIQVFFKDTVGAEMFSGVLPKTLKRSLRTKGIYDIAMLPEGARTPSPLVHAYERACVVASVMKTNGVNFSLLERTWSLVWTGDEDAVALYPPAILTRNPRRICERTKDRGYSRFILPNATSAVRVRATAAINATEDRSLGFDWAAAIFHLSTSAMTDQLLTGGSIAERKYGLADIPGWTRTEEWRHPNVEADLPPFEGIVHTTTFDPIQARLKQLVDEVGLIDVYILDEFEDAQGQNPQRNRHLEPNLRIARAHGVEDAVELFRSSASVAMNIGPEAAALDNSIRLQRMYSHGLQVSPADVQGSSDAGRAMLKRLLKMFDNQPDAVHMRNVVFYVVYYYARDVNVAFSGGVRRALQAKLHRARIAAQRSGPVRLVCKQVAGEGAYNDFQASPDHDLFLQRMQRAIGTSVCRMTTNYPEWARDHAREYMATWDDRRESCTLRANALLKSCVLTAWSHHKDAMEHPAQALAVTAVGIARAAVRAVCGSVTPSGYADFMLLWRTAHMQRETRFNPLGGITNFFGGVLRYMRARPFKTPANEEKILEAALIDVSKFLPGLKWLPGHAYQARRPEQWRAMANQLGGITILDRAYAMSPDGVGDLIAICSTRGEQWTQRDCLEDLVSDMVYIAWHGMGMHAPDSFTLKDEDFQGLSHYQRQRDTVVARQRRDMALSCVLNGFNAAARSIVKWYVQDFAVPTAARLSAPAMVPVAPYIEPTPDEGRDALMSMMAASSEPITIVGLPVDADAPEPEPMRDPNFLEIAQALYRYVPERGTTEFAVVMSEVKARAAQNDPTAEVD